MKYLFFAVFIFSGLTGFSQEKLEGIGKIKVHKSTATALVKELKTDLMVLLDTISDNKMEYKSRKFAEIVPNVKKIGESHASANFCPKVRVLFLAEYNVGGIPYKEIFLTFFRDTLVEMKWNGSAVVKRWYEDNYGVGDVRLESKPSGCSGKTNETNKTTWSNGDIKAQEVRSTYFFGTDCTDYGNHTFYIVYVPRQQEVKTCNATAKAKLGGGK